MFYDQVTAKWMRLGLEDGNEGNRCTKKSRTEDALLGFYAGTDYLSIIIASFRILNVLRNIGI
jgi:hypothetical protein